MKFLESNYAKLGFLVFHILGCLYFIWLANQPVTDPEQLKLIPFLKWGGWLSLLGLTIFTIWFVSRLKNGTYKLILFGQFVAFLGIGLLYVFLMPDLLWWLGIGLLVSMLVTTLLSNKSFKI